MCCSPIEWFLRELQKCPQVSTRCALHLFSHRSYVSTHHRKKLRTCVFAILFLVASMSPASFLICVMIPFLSSLIFAKDFIPFSLQEWLLRPCVFSTKHSRVTQVDENGSFPVDGQGDSRFGRARQTHKQAPRMFLCMLAGLEQLVVSQSAAPYLRLFSWWICLQHWRTLRSPSSIALQGIGFSAVLSPSRTLGRDKQVQSRPVVVHGLAFLTVPDWLRVGWELLKVLADFPRDYLLPPPSSFLKGCLRSELQYDAGSAIFKGPLFDAATG